MAADETTRELRKPEYLLRYLKSTGRDSGTDRNIRCPNASMHTNGDRDPSARIYVSREGHASIKCHGGCGESWDVFALYGMDHPGCTFKDAKAALVSMLGVDGAQQKTDGEARAGCSRRDAAPCTAPAKQAPDEKTAAYIRTCQLHYCDDDYLKSRGISDETAARFGIGFDPGSGAVVIPNGSGYASRKVGPGAGKKDRWRYFPAGAARSVYPLGAIERAAKDGRAVFIVEGEIDALSIYEAGGIAVASGGAGAVRKVVEAVKAVGGGVYIPCMDRDKDGETAYGKLMEGLKMVEGAYVHPGAPSALMPDRSDGTHAKDANEALQEDAAAFRDRVARIERAAMESASAPPSPSPGCRGYITLAELPPPIREEENPRALFKGGFLRCGGGVILSSMSGVGKSTFVIQAVLNWSVGRPAFGIAPVRPLKIALIQAEDDEEEMYSFRESMRRGFAADGQTEETFKLALSRLHVRMDFEGKTGEDFSRALQDVQRRERYDLVVVNPLYSYFEGDVSSNKDVSHFFRELVDPVVKSPETQCGILFVHHFGKTPRVNDSDEWRNNAQYRMMNGASELSNWARAVLLIHPFGNSSEFFNLIAAKRGARLGWTDAAGRPTNVRIIAHSEGFAYWREPTREEVEALRALNRGKSRKGESDGDGAARRDMLIRKMVEAVTGEEMSKSGLENLCKKNPDFKCADGKRALEEFLSSPEKFGVRVDERMNRYGKTCRFYSASASCGAGPKHGEAGE